MLRYMLDSNTCIAVMKAASVTLGGRFTRHATQLCLSAIALGELRFGAEKSQRAAENRSSVDDFVGRLVVLDFDADAALHFGQIRHALRRQPIGPLDTLIAAHALSRGLVVVTDNVREFRRVPALQVENWIRRA